jgi:endo-1,4-beta-xylanase
VLFLRRTYWLLKRESKNTSFNAGAEVTMDRKQLRLTRALVYLLLMFTLWGCTRSEPGELATEAVGLQAVYFDNENFTGGQVKRVDASINFNWEDQAPAPGIAPDTFSVRWTGSITPRYSELYTFIAQADDGLRLWVNGIKLIDDWAYTPEQRYARLRLEANKRYAIRIEYYEGEGWASVNLSWRSRSQQSELLSGLSTAPGLATGLSASASLRDLAYARGILIGGALDPKALANEASYRDTAKREFNFLSPEGGFSIYETHTPQDVFNLRPDLSELDSMVDFARQNGAQIQAFHLVWYLESFWTRWLNDIPSAQRWPFIQKHMSDLMTRYKGKVQYYNVVNEAFDDDGKLRGSTITLNGEQGTNWLAPLGQSYIENSFREARKIDPSAKLFYNDYGLETDGPKWDAVLAMVKDFKARGVPIDGVGFQGHLALRYGIPDPAVLEDHFRQLYKLGVEVRITEFDLGIEGAPGGEGGRLATQAKYYKKFLNVCLGALNCTAFHMWGFSDKYSWVANLQPDGSSANKPLIFDVNYKPKPSYYALQNALRGR